MSNNTKTRQHSGARQPKKLRGARQAAKKTQRSARPRNTDTAARGGTKQAILIDLLSHPKGVTSQISRRRSAGSLSQIARIITGARWSGPLFFGLRKAGS